MELEEQLNEWGGSQINDGVQRGRAACGREVPGEAEPSPCPGSSKQTLILLSSVQI